MSPSESTTNLKTEHYIVYCRFVEFTVWISVLALDRLELHLSLNLLIRVKQEKFSDPYQYRIL